MKWKLFTRAGRPLIEQGLQYREPGVKATKKAANRRWSFKKVDGGIKILCGSSLNAILDNVTSSGYPNRGTVGALKPRSRDLGSSIT